MLPGKSHHQQKQARQSDSKLFHFAASLRILHFYQARIVDRLGKINFRSSSPCTFLPRSWSYAVCSRHLCHPSQTGFELCSFLLRDRVPEGEFFFLGERV